MIKGVKYISMAETSGYGLSAVAYIRALLETGVPVTWRPQIMVQGRYQPAVDVEQAVAMLASSPDTGDLRSAYRAPIEYDTVLVHMTPEYWPAMIEPGKRMVGYTVWETDRLPLHWPPLLACCDVVLTPSTFSRDVFAPHSESPVAVIPHLPRTDWPGTDPGSLAAFRRRFAIEKDDFVFYTINTWLLRKAMWLTLQAYLLAFSESDRVVLFVKTDPYGEAEGKRFGASRRYFDSIMSNYPDPPRVVFVQDELSHEDMGLLHQTGDAFVSLTRGEGFGMGAFDAATAGTPVITTGWSGHLDFLPAQHACLVDYELQRVKAHLGHHAPQENYWAHADLDHAIDWMRYLYENPAEARNRGEGLKEHIAGSFNTESITRRLLEALTA